MAPGLLLDRRSVSDEKRESTDGERMELPTWNRTRTKRTKRGPGAEDDAFQATVRKSGRSAINNTRLTLGIGLLVVVVIAVSVYVYDRQRSKRAEATRVLASAVAFEARAKVGEPDQLPDGSVRNPPFPLLKEEAQRAERVNKTLGELSDSEGGSAADIAGDLVRAAQKMKFGNHAEAVDLYRRFLERAPEQHPLAFLAREGLGFALEASGDLEGALREYKLLGPEKGGFYRDAALYHQGRVLEALGRQDEALEIYRKYNTEYPQTEMSMAQQEVRARLEALDPAALTNPAAEPPAAPEGEEAGETP